MDKAECHSSPRKQTGAVAIIVALAIVALVGFAGLALDLGRLFITKTELQDGADSCALAAAAALTGVDANQLQIGEDWGITAGTRNKTLFQSAVVTIVRDQDVTFSDTLDGAYLTKTAASGNALAMKYARCTVTQADIPTWFIQVLNAMPGVAIGSQTVRATAVGSLGPSQANCAIPLGMCSQGPATGTPPFGLVEGQWYSGKFNSGGGLTGSFNWIDFTPPAGGESELAALLTGSGLCNMNVPNPVGQPGNMGNAAGKAWNSRFGLYQGGGGNPTLNSAPPDFTGYSYTDVNWTSQFNVLSDFRSKRTANASYGANVDAGNTLTGLSINNSYNPTTTPAQHAASGADRRLVTVPIVNCGEWAGSNTIPIRGWACVLMLHPIDAPGDVIRMEYEGLSTETGTPCGTSGLPAGPGAGGPKVPMLVQ